MLHRWCVRTIFQPWCGDSCRLSSCRGFANFGSSCRFDPNLDVGSTPILFIFAISLYRQRLNTIFTRQLLDRVDYSSRSLSNMLVHVKIHLAAQSTFHFILTMFMPVASSFF